MHVRAVALAALAAALPAPALAEVEADPRWNMGAGVGGSLGEVYLATPGARLNTSPFLPLSFLFGTAVPVATFFVERRVGERSWLVFGAAGSLERQDEEPPPSLGATSTASTKNDAERVSVSAGLRRVVTRRGALVDLSLVGTVEGGYVHAELELTSGAGERSRIRDTGGYAALRGGLALERELTGGLALRLSSPLVAASWSKVERRDASGTRDATAAIVSMALAPRLELRLAF